MSLKEPTYKYINKSDWEVIYVDSEEAKGVKDRAIDGNPGTYWITVWRGTPAPLPHEIQIDFKRSLDVAQVHYLNRQDNFGPDGAIGEYEVYLSDSLNDWGEPAAKGEIQWTQELADH